MPQQTTTGTFGTCVEFRKDQSEPNYLEDGDEGAPVLCHLFSTDTTAMVLNASNGLKLVTWSTPQWGSGTPTTTPTNYGTDISLANYGTTFSPSNTSPGATLTAGAVYSVSWYQPLETTDYGTGLRRYQKDDYVMAWSIETQGTTTSTFKATVARNGIVTLAGAEGLLKSMVGLGASILLLTY